MFEFLSVFYLCFIRGSFLSYMRYCFAILRWKARARCYSL